LAKQSRALAGRLRRAQTFLRTLGIEIVFGREGRVGTRVIRIQRHDQLSAVDGQHRRYRQREAISAGTVTSSAIRLSGTMPTVLTQISDEIRVGSKTATAMVLSKGREAPITAADQ
jgi:hypothetical protein